MPVPQRLRDAADQELAAWLDAVSTLDSSDIDIVLPEGDDLTETLRWLQVPESAIPEIAGARPHPSRHPEGWWILERCVVSLVAGMGQPNAPFAAFPELPATLPGVPPHLYIHAFVATLPHVLAYHRERGIDEGQSQAILGDLGRNVRVHDKRYGEVGLGVVFWITLHFRGLIYELGRLQFERTPMRRTIAEAVRAQGIEADPDELVLSLHIPDFLGPITPAAVDNAMVEARVFFDQHFPEERYRFAVCHSWMLDPQLRHYLRPEANILRFQDRFSLADACHEADRSIVQFVFGPVPEDPAELPGRTSLERAVRTHLVEGRHWHVRSGWFRLDGT